jgi:hypothetical protein
MSIKHPKGTTKKGKKAKTDEVHPEKIASKIARTNPNCLEVGHIHFFYRPKEGIMEVEKFDDISKLYIVLSSKSGTSRLVAIPKKTLPLLQETQHYFAFVEKVSDEIDPIVSQLGEHSHQTKLAGTRVRPCARVLATGVYGIYTHNATHGGEDEEDSDEVGEPEDEESHTHLAYVLDYPETITPLHKQFHISHEGTFLVDVKNPDASISLFPKKEKAKFPGKLQEHFGENKWAPLLPEFLNYPGTQLRLLGAGIADIPEARRISENVAELEEWSMAEVQCSFPKDIFKQIRADKYKLPTDPLKGNMV